MPLEVSLIVFFVAFTFYSGACACIWCRLSERLQVFDQVLALLRRQPEIETRVVAVDDIQQGRKTAVMVKSAFILRFHEECAFAGVKPRQVHRLVGAGGRSVRLEG